MSTLTAAWLFWGLCSQTAAADSAFTITEESISARFEGAPLSSIMELIQSKTGIAYSLTPELASREVSVKFDALPYNVAFGRIFKDLDYSLVFDGFGAVERIDIYGVADRPASTVYVPPAGRASEMPVVDNAGSPFLPPREKMVIEKPDPSDGMPYIPPKEEMVVVKPKQGDGMPYIPPREKMVITQPDPSDGMHYIPPKETMQPVGRQ